MSFFTAELEAKRLGMLGVEVPPGLSARADEVIEQGAGRFTCR